MDALPEIYITIIKEGPKGTDGKQRLPKAMMCKRKILDRSNLICIHCCSVDKQWIHLKNNVFSFRMVSG